MEDFSLRLFFIFIILAFLAQTFLACGDEVSLDDLQFTFVDGYINANLAPVVPPDPISCKLVFHVENTSYTETISGLDIKEAEVFLIDTNQKLGDIDLTTTWDGMINPHEQVTVVLEKSVGQIAAFKPPCGQAVYINVVVRDISDRFTVLKVNSLMFMCSY